MKDSYEPNLTAIIEFLSLSDDAWSEFTSIINARSVNDNEEVLYLAKLDLKLYPDLSDVLNRIINILEASLI
ncbi:hypothetical protein Acj133p038 [Acinetobacter phage 133]|uniref:Uncharacterized protein n=1 Tax=Acinetobacter phage 133 TaxID=2919552 RepID=D9I604_9CAUD|nr:hypothetical protein Acj133p038 [Acinetobacter phage 133]ADJ19385.1 hypothetical protein Acj133p038 [Acinetobacter phage 133]